MIPSPTRAPAARLLTMAAIAFAGFFLLGFGGIFVWGGNQDTTTPIWPATAFGIVLMLRLSRGRADDIAMLAAMLPAGFLANHLGGASLAVTAGFSVINVIDVMAGVYATRLIGIRRIRDGASAIKFGLAAGISPALLGAGLSCLLIAAHGSGDPLLTGVQWFFANLLGVCILFPLGLTLSLRQFAKLKLEHRYLEAMCVFSALTAVAILGFRYGMPLLFLALVAAMAAASRFRLLGAGAALIILSVFSFVSVRTLPQAHSLQWILMLQFYLGVCSLVCVRAATLLNERDLHVAIIERRHRRAVRASRFKTQLLAHVSHEVRSPLSAIIGFSGMLESGSLSADRAPEFAAIIGHNGELLQRLHDDLLDLSRAEAGVLAMSPCRVPVGSTLLNCVEGIRLDATLGGKDVLIESVEAEMALRCDPLRLAQVLNNLIANAYKYGDNFSPIRLRASRLADGFGRIEVVNAGPGIPAHERAAVFLPFRRSDTVGRNVAGAGLGLSIAKMLVEAQGGRIDFESVPGRQTRFWIDLPLVA